MSRRFRRGLVVGKFAPLHLGHELVIKRALGACDSVLVLSYSNPELPGCTPARRQSWLEGRFPDARVVVVPGEQAPPNEAADSLHRAFCAQISQEVAGPRVDAVFTSETYGGGFARELGRLWGAEVAHVSVDEGRSLVPISGTALRADVHGLRRFLAPSVYASFVGRVVLLGGESSGKSTLAQALAESFESTHVEEYGRTLWEDQDGHLSFEDLERIATTQIAMEEAAAERAVRYLFCDTSPLTTLFYSHQMFGRAAPALVELARRPYDATFLCVPDFEFVQDGTRREPEFRQRGHEWYVRELAARGIDYGLCTGSLAERVEQVRAALA